MWNRFYTLLVFIDPYFILASPVALLILFSMHQILFSSNLHISSALCSCTYVPTISLSLQRSANTSNDSCTKMYSLGLHSSTAQGKPVNADEGCVVVYRFLNSKHGMTSEYPLAHGEASAESLCFGSRFLVRQQHCCPASITIYGRI